MVNKETQKSKSSFVGDEKNVTTINVSRVDDIHKKQKMVTKDAKDTFQPQNRNSSTVPDQTVGTKPKIVAGLKKSLVLPSTSTRVNPNNPQKCTDQKISTNQKSKPKKDLPTVKAEKSSVGNNLPNTKTTTIKVESKLASNHSKAQTNATIHTCQKASPRRKSLLARTSKKLTGDIQASKTSSRKRKIFKNTDFVERKKEPKKISPFTTEDVPMKKYPRNSGKLNILEIQPHPNDKTFIPDITDNENTEPTWCCCGTKGGMIAGVITSLICAIHSFIIVFKSYDDIQDTKDRIILTVLGLCTLLCTCTVTLQVILLFRDLNSNPILLRTAAIGNHVCRWLCIIWISCVVVFVLPLLCRYIYKSRVLIPTLPIKIKVIEIFEVTSSRSDGKEAETVKLGEELFFVAFEVDKRNGRRSNSIHINRNLSYFELWIEEKDYGKIKFMINDSLLSVEDFRTLLSESESREETANFINRLIIEILDLFLFIGYIFIFSRLEDLQFQTIENLSKNNMNCKTHLNPKH